MLRLVAVHDDAMFGFEFPCACIHIEHNDIHAEVHCRLLCRETSAERVVEEHHQQILVLAEGVVFETVGLDLEGFFKNSIEIAKVGYIQEFFHIEFFFDFSIIN